MERKFKLEWLTVYKSKTWNRNDHTLNSFVIFTPYHKENPDFYISYKNIKLGTVGYLYRTPLVNEVIDNLLKKEKDFRNALSINKKLNFLDKNKWRESNIISMLVYDKDNYFKILNINVNSTLTKNIIFDILLALKNGIPNKEYPYIDNIPIDNSDKKVMLYSYTPFAKDEKIDSHSLFTLSKKIKMEKMISYICKTNQASTEELNAFIRFIYDRFFYTPLTKDYDKLEVESMIYKWMNSVLKEINNSKQDDVDDFSEFMKEYKSNNKEDGIDNDDVDFSKPLEDQVKTKENNEQKPIPITQSEVDRIMEVDEDNDYLWR